MSSVSSLTSTPTTAATQPAISFNGLVSGLDTNSIIQGLLAVDQQQITDKTNQEKAVQNQQSAFQAVETKLLKLQTDIHQLNAPTNGVFDGRTATSSNSGVVSAAASSSAVPGVYSLTVNGIAQAQQIASQGFASATGAISQGTLQFQIGNGAAATITIDSSNNTLQGLAGAINSANTGLTATVINDGSSNEPYRLLLTAKNTGTANAVTITNNLAASGGGAVQPIFNANSIGAASSLSGATGGSSVPSANTGAGAYTGTANNSYTFTVVNGGTVGTDNGITLSYSDATGTHTGTITLNASDVNALQNVAQGLQVQFSTGTLNAGQSFSVKAYVPTVQAAQDASITLGSGDGALTVTSSTNQINNLIAGVTLQLQANSANQPVSVTVGADTSKAQSAIDGFVSDYNDLMSYISQQTSYDATSNTAGPLLGNSNVYDIENELRQLAQAVVPGVNPQMNNLSDLGITVDNTGQLQVDDTKLGSILNGSISGVSLKDIRNLFAMSGSSPNPGLTFIYGDANTKGSSTPYTVNITQAATQAAVTGANAVGSVIDASNSTFAFSLDGVSSSVTLATGTYTPDALAQMLQAAINGDHDLSGRQVSVGVQNGQLTITSASFGSSSRVGVGGGTANAVLGFAGTELSQGQDVAGNFIVGGKTETGHGVGQLLIGDATNANTADLEVNVTLTPAQVGTGAQASLTVTRGIASQFDALMSQLTDAQTGRLKTIDDNYNNQITDIQGQVTQLTAAMNAKQQQLQTQFANMENTLAQLQAASSALNGLTLSLNSLVQPKTSSPFSSSSSNTTGS